MQCHFTSHFWFVLMSAEVQVLYRPTLMRVCPRIIYSFSLYYVWTCVSVCLKISILNHSRLHLISI